MVFYLRNNSRLHTKVGSCHPRKEAILKRAAPPVSLAAVMLRCFTCFTCFTAVTRKRKRHTLLWYRQSTPLAYTTFVRCGTAEQPGCSVFYDKCFNNQEATAFSVKRNRVSAIGELRMKPSCFTYVKAQRLLTSLGFLRVLRRSHAAYPVNTCPVGFGSVDPAPIYAIITYHGASSR